MIYKLISQVGQETFAALVGTDPEDKFILEVARFNIPAKRVVGRKSKRKAHKKMKPANLIHQGRVGIGYTDAEAAHLFRQWQEKNFYAFGKHNHEVHDFAHQSTSEIPDKKRPFEGMKVLRRFSIRPLVVVNLNKCPEAMQQIIKITEPFKLQNGQRALE